MKIACIVLFIAGVVVAIDSPIDVNDGGVTINEGVNAPGVDASRKTSIGKDGFHRESDANIAGVEGSRNTDIGPDGFSQDQGVSGPGGNGVSDSTKFGPEGASKSTDIKGGPVKASKSSAVKVPKAGSGEGVADDETADDDSDPSKPSPQSSAADSPDDESAPEGEEEAGNEGKDYYSGCCALAAQGACDNPQQLGFARTFCQKSCGTSPCRIEQVMECTVSVDPNISAANCPALG